MPPVGAVKLDVIYAQSQEDKVKAALRGIQSELRKTEADLQAISKAEAANAAADQLFLASKIKKADELASRRRADVLATRAQAEAERARLGRAAAIEAGTSDPEFVAQQKFQGQQKKLQADQEAARALVQKARAEREAQTVTKSASDGLKAATKVQETFNKVIGLAGFAGVIAGAGVAVVEFIKDLTGYGAAIKASEEITGEFRDRLRELKSANLEFDKSHVDADLRKRIEYSERFLQQNTQLVVQASSRVIKEQALAELFRQQNEYQDLANRGGAVGEVAAIKLKEIRKEIAETGTFINESLEAEAKNQQVVAEAAGRTTEAYERASKAAQILADFGAKKAVDAGTALALVDKLEENDRKEEARQAAKAKEEAKERGAAAADRIRELERDLELSRARTESDKSALRIAYLEVDARRGVITEREKELRIAIERETRIAAIKADREKKEKEFEDHAKKRAEKAAADRKRGDEKEDKQREEDEKKALDERIAKFKEYSDAIRLTSGALNGLRAGLGGVADSLASAVDMWGKFDEKNDKLGKTLASSLSVVGKGIAAQIKNKKAQALTEGLFEQAAALASFGAGDLVGGGFHEAAAIGFFALAASGGGGGKKGGAASAGGGAASSGGSTSGGAGGGTIVNNYTRIDTGPVTDTQGLQRTMNRLNYSARNTMAGNPAL